MSCNLVVDLSFLSSALTLALSSPGTENSSSQNQTIGFSITLVNAPKYTSLLSADDGLSKAIVAVEQMRVTSSALEPTQDVVSSSTTIIDNTKCIAATWGPLLQGLKRFTEIVDGISEVRHV